MEPIDQMPAPARHVRDYLAIVWQRKWLCLFVFILLSSVGLFVVVKVVKPWYQARARISIGRLRAPLSEQVGHAGEAFYQTQYEMMGSSNVAALAAYKLGRSDSREQAKADGTAHFIRRAVSIQPEASNRVVRVTSRQRAPEAAAAVVNKVVEAYIEFAKANEEEIAKRRQKEIQDHIDLLELDIASQKKAIDEFTKDKKLQEQRRQQILITSTITGLAREEIHARVNRESAEEEYNEKKSLYDAGEDLVEDVVSPEAERINVQIKEYETRLNMFTVGKTPSSYENHPEYMRLKELIDLYRRDYSDALAKARKEANKRALAFAENAFTREKKLEEKIAANLAELNTKLAELVEGLTALSRYEELLKELGSLQALRDTLKKNLLTSRLSDDMTLLNITVLDDATVPKTPAWPNKMQLAVVVVALSFLVAAGCAFFLDYMDRTVRRPEDVEQELRMPFVGFIPSMYFAADNSRRREKVIMTDPTSGPAEAYRKIRAKLNVYKAESKARSFAITSTTAGEGKTTVASNLAIAFAQSGYSVLLADADMRHPKMHEVYQLERRPGLGEYLAGVCSWQSVVRSSGINGLSVITAGTGGSRSAELLESPRLPEFIEQASVDYDLVIFDAPPVLGVADATVISNLADATIFVIQASMNSKWLIRRAKMELAAAEARVVGAVLNRVRSQRGDYYYYHRYYPKKT
ncbi:MAG: polysaccharide biosynthesis tyrosine autokinase [Planctomycetota bacterium]|jgi:capsular exopolysaccharide synthesis family protein